MDEVIIKELAQSTESIKRLDSLFSHMASRQEELSQSQQSLDSKFDSAIELLMKLNIGIVQSTQSMERYCDKKIHNEIILLSGQIDKKMNDCKIIQDNINNSKFMSSINPVSLIKVSTVVIILMVVPMILGCAVAVGIDVVSVWKAIVDIFHTIL